MCALIEMVRPLTESQHDENEQSLNQCAKEQIQLWKPFFPKLDSKELHTAVLSGLTLEMAVQMNHYLSEETYFFGIPRFN